MNKNLLPWWAHRGVKSKIVLLALAAISLFNFRAYALVMRENGPEPIIVQIKESLRTSDDLDNRLSELAALRQQQRMKVEKWWAGRKLLVMLSFPTNFTEQEALGVIVRLQQSPTVEKIVVISAYNLEFQSGDFAREYGPNARIPDAARRGFDADRIGKPEPAAPDEIALLQTRHVPNRLIVGWKEECVWKKEATGFSRRMADLHREAGCRVIDELWFGPTKLHQVLEFDGPATLAEKLQKYVRSGFVVYAQPDYIYESTAMPNDPAYSGAPGPQWSLSNIKAEQAWNLTTGDASTIIAVGDSGANVTNTEFSANLWAGQNNTCSTSERKNFVTTIPAKYCNVSDDYGHGSHVASILGARGNNGEYVTGVAWATKLMILKVTDFSGFGTSQSIASGINFAWQRGATAINLSLGVRKPPNCQSGECVGGLPDSLIVGAVKNARDNNMIVVSAAGNDRGKFHPDGQPMEDNDEYVNTVFPTNVATDNNISVLATDRYDNLASYSSFGASRVDLAAPGGEPNDQIIGLSRVNGNYSFSYGTSQAAPHVTGALALIKSRFPWENYLGLRDRLLMGTDRISALEGYCRTNGRLNLEKALQGRTMLSNLSTRARVEGGDRKMIGGFSIGSASATGHKLRVAIRAMGPSVGVSGSVQRLTNPTIKLNKPNGQSRVQNNSGPTDYANPAERTELQSKNLLPADPREPAIIEELDPGQYTVEVDSQDGASGYGVGTFEIYELEGNTDERARLLNLSTRCIVGTGEEEPIAGMIITAGSDTDPLRPDRRVLMFGKGPSLPLSGKLLNPAIQVLNTGESNDNWQALPVGMVEEIDEANREPTNTLESALWPTFRPGVYFVTLRGVNQSTGIGLLELYEY